jgi:hypothetical protein
MGSRMAEPVDEFKATLDELILRRAEWASMLADADQYDILEKLATIHTAIAALEAVIASES